MKLLCILLTCLIHIYVISGREIINKIFEEINNKFVEFNSQAAEISWESSLNPGKPGLQSSTANYQKTWVVWLEKSCEQLAALQNRHLLNSTQRRQTYLLCRGPKFSYREARELTSVYDELQSMYSNNKICIPIQRNVSKENAHEIETAILNYLSTVKQLLKTDSATYASKMAAKNDLNYGLCFDGENEFESLIRKLKNEDVLRWLWLVWREKIGGPMKEPYRRLVDLENRAAWQKGYSDIGVAWRDELEIPNLRRKCRQLYSEVRPLYTLLHGVVRFYLRKTYGEVVPKNGPIPAHLLGNLWSQNWETLADLISPKKIDLDESIRNLNWTVEHMVKRVEDFYQSLGLPAMTDVFWRESVFNKKNNGMRCHGTAADMFKHNDYRLLYCAGTSMDDLYVLHHEFGHIEYYMAYENQPGLFRQANAALHESIGDAIMYGVMTPQHLQRLGLVNDSILYVDASRKFNERSKTKLNLSVKDKQDITNDALKTKDCRENVDEADEIFETGDDRPANNHVYFNPNEIQIEGDVKGPNTNSNADCQLKNDEILLLKQALNKIPQIPFALVIDEYRWKYFEGRLNKHSLNQEFWDLSLELQGIAPPEGRGEEYFDVGAKFHVPDNTPYIRYFLSSFIQHQLFEALCRSAVFGRRDVNARIPASITRNRCDIYGSKAAGKLLKDIMSRGNSQHWQEILMSTTGNTDISAAAFLRYYRPLYDVLARIVKKNKIPLGWQ